MSPESYKNEIEVNKDKMKDIEDRIKRIKGNKTLGSMSSEDRMRLNGLSFKLSTIQDRNSNLLQQWKDDMFNRHKENSF